MALQKNISYDDNDCVTDIKLCLIFKKVYCLLVLWDYKKDHYSIILKYSF